MLTLNIGSCMLRLSSCMLMLNLTSSVQVGSCLPWGLHPPPWPPWVQEVRLSLNMHEPMLSLSMLGPYLDHPDWAC